MATAVIELNSLPNAVRPAAEDDDLLLVRRRRFVFLFVSGIEIRRVALELRCASIHAFIDRLQLVLLPRIAHLRAGAFAALDAKQIADANVAQPGALGVA